MGGEVEEEVEDEVESLGGGEMWEGEVEKLGERWGEVNWGDEEG